jgi:hypothetical protein
MLPKTGKVLPKRSRGNGASVDFNQNIAATLRAELGSSHRAVHRDGESSLAWTSGSGIGDRLEPQHEPQEEIGEVIRRAVTAGDQEALELFHSGRLKGQSSDRGII